MPTLNPHADHLINDYIARQPENMREICTKLRQLIHQADPMVKEDWNWGPNFYRDGMVCGLEAAGAWVVLTFFNGSLMEDKYQLFNYTNKNPDYRSIKFAHIADIKEPVLIAYIQEAVAHALAHQTPQSSSLPKKEKDRAFKTNVLPAYIRNSLAEHDLAKKFNAFPYSHRKEYIEWIEGAKNEETKHKRLSEALARISQGKGWYNNNL